ncbi:hypothetical protein T01_8604 [Trichinella spiralis]|uniref:Uncharacterized protein n=1 Tax=Trichinella spiralis TaxID=6334 RepID=A0A0V1AIL2_TRISP|nr:hypothetical protein T01_8604 [Trichinella spiralis]
MSAQWSEQWKNFLSWFGNAYKEGWISTKRRP